MKRALLLLGSLLVLTTSIIYAQQRSITGKVVDALNNQPLPGVTVSIKGEEASATQTNENGDYSLSAEAGQTIVFQYIGMETVERIVGRSETVNVSMEGSAEDLQDVVVVGYGTQKRANLTGAVSTIDPEKTLESRAITDIGRGLQGAVPGLTITTTSGQIGRNPTIRLRGSAGSLNATAGAKPLILVDNVEVQSLQMINPQDVESISVLKDAASTSIYGTRAAWGVILITTKSGKKNTPFRINYSNNFAYSSPTETPEVAGAYDGAQMTLQALRRSANNPNLNSFGVLGMYFDEIGNQKIKEWEEKYSGQNLGPEMVYGRDYEVRDGDHIFFYRPWDPIDMYTRDWAPYSKNDLSFSGGTDKTSFNLNIGYMNQYGALAVNPDEFNRFNANLGVTSDINEWVSVRGKFMHSASLTTQPYIFGSSTIGPWYYLYRWPKIYPYGTIDGKPFRSALTEVQQATMDQEKEHFTRVNLGGTLRPAKGLSIALDYSYTGNNDHLHQVGGGTSGIDFWGGQLTYLDNYQSSNFDAVSYYSYWDQLHNARAMATFLKDIGDHSFKFMAGGDMDLYQEWSQTSERRELIDPTKGEIGLATGDQFVYGMRRHWATLGFVGRINYDYKDKFLLELNGRYDGSSRFPNNDQWAFFPSFSAGYVLSEESFLEPSKNWLSFLKVRGSWGTVGNQDVGGPNGDHEYRFLSVMNSYNSGWWIGDSNQLTFGTPGEVAPTLSWERVTTLDLGLDAQFLDNKLGLTFDWYKRTTSDMISPGVTLPSSYGGASPVRNYGEMETNGWELTLTYNQRFENGLNLSLTGLLSDYTEEITKYANTTMGIYSNRNGRILGEIWGYETERLYQESDFNGQDADGNWILKDGLPDQSYLVGNNTWFKFGPGDVMYKDLNGDGEITPGSETMDDSGDLTVIGNSTPRYQYGLNLSADWKGVDVSMFWQGVGRRDLWPNGNIFIPGYKVSEAWFSHQTDYWTTENTDAFYPRPTNQGESSSLNFNRQSRYLLDLSYLRLKNIQIGYTLPTDLTQQIKLNRVRIYASGENLLTFSNANIPIDPEVDYDPGQTAIAFGRVYPYRKTISFGLQVTM